MTAGLPETPPDLASWAARELDVDQGASPAEVRAALLRLLPAEDFVPAPSWQQAARLLSGRQRSGGSAGTLDQEDEDEEELRAQVEQFAVDFFQVPAAQRRQRWQELLWSCTRSVPLTARLRALECCLAMDPAVPAGASAHESRLVAKVCELFVLRPAERAAARQEFLAGLGSEAGAYEKAAQRLRSQQPPLAALEPELLGRLASWDQEQRRLETQRRRAREKEMVTVPRSPAKGSAGWFVWLLVMLVLGLIKGVSSPGSRTGSERPNLDVPTENLLQRLKEIQEQQPNVPGMQDWQKKLRRFQWKSDQDVLKQIEKNKGRPLTREEREAFWIERNRLGLPPVEPLQPDGPRRKGPGRLPDSRDAGKPRP